MLNELTLVVLVTVFTILLIGTIRRTYWQFIRPRLVGVLERKRIKRIIQGDMKLLKRVAIQQSLFKAAPQFHTLSAAAQELLLSNISYHVIAREGNHWDLDQTAMFIQNISEDPDFDMVAELALAGKTMKEVIERMQDKLKEEDQED